MEEAQGFISVGTQLVTVFATFIGASLLTIYTESSLAMLTALIFLIVTLLYWSVKSPLKKQEDKLFLKFP